MNKKQILLMGLVLCAHAVVQSRSIFEDSLDEFLERVVDEEDRVGFRSFYSRFLEQQTRARKNRKERHLRRLRHAALRKIRDQQPAWYKQLEPFAFDLDESTSEARKVRLFLTRYALLEEYQKSLQSDDVGWWDKTKGFFKDLRLRISKTKDRMLGRKVETVMA